MECRPHNFSNYGYIAAPIWGKAYLFSPMDFYLAIPAEDYPGCKDRWIMARGTLTDSTCVSKGDVRLNQKPVPGGNMAWTNAEVARTTLSADVVSGTTTSVAVAACPSPRDTGRGRRFTVYREGLTFTASR